VLLSRLDENTGRLVQSLSMFVLGAGIGCAMQVLTLVVQNTVHFRDLGSATSGVTFFRTLGGSFGASIMGSIYANQLAGLLPAALHEAGVPATAASSPAAVHALPAVTRAPIVAAYAEVIQNLFLWVVPVAVLGLLVALVLPQVALRGTAGRDAVRSTGEGFAAPSDPTSDAVLETMIGRIVRRNPDIGKRILASSGVGVDGPTAWGLLRVHLRERLLEGPARQEDVEDQIHVPHGVLTSFYDGLVTAGHLVRAGDHLQLTPSGQAVVETLVDAWSSWLLEEVRGAVNDQDDLDARVRSVVRRSARRVLLEQRELQPA
jgi:hypothetical protein